MLCCYRLTFRLVELGTKESRLEVHGTSSWRYIKDKRVRWRWPPSLTSHGARGGRRLTRICDGWSSRKHRLEMYEFYSSCTFLDVSKRKMVVGLQGSVWRLLCAHLTAQSQLLSVVLTPQPSSYNGCSVASFTLCSCFSSSCWTVISLEIVTLVLDSNLIACCVSKAAERHWKTN